MRARQGRTIKIAMKTILHVLVVLTACITAGQAGDPVPVKSLPAAVATAVEEHLPGAEIVAAGLDDDDDRPFYDLKVEHRGIMLELEVTPSGRVREIDLNQRAPSLRALISEGAPLALDELPAEVTVAVEDFLPDSKILSASEKIVREQRVFDLVVRHQDLSLRIRVTRRGEILDIDTIKR